MKTLVLLGTIATLAATAARADYEVCKGVSRDGTTLTLIGDNNNQVDPELGSYITINANGHQQKVLMESADSCGDVHECYVSQDGGKTLKVTFYDEDNTASGYSDEFGAFKLSCKTVSEDN